METILNINGLTKSYGKIHALKNVSLSIPKGSIYGILGPNGSGKTTLMSIILDVLKADSGTYNWFGQMNHAAERKRIGSLLETPNFYHYLSGLENLRITQSISERGDEEAIEQVLATVRLRERKKSRFSTYSLGMKQRLAIGAALLGNPEVLLLDEPTNGLDPVGIAEIRQLIISLASQGITIIIASHLLDEVEKMCSHVAILKSGDLMAAGAVQEVLMQEDIVELSAKNMHALTECLKGMGGFTGITEEQNRLCLFYPAGKADLEYINQYCFNHGIILQQLLLRKKSLETIFLELTN